MPTGISFDASTHIFIGTATSTGTYMVTVSATDSKDAAAYATFTITVNPPANQPPVYVSLVRTNELDGGRMTPTFHVLSADPQPSRWIRLRKPTRIAMPPCGRHGRPVSTAMRRLLFTSEFISSRSDELSAGSSKCRNATILELT